ncbi:MAG TPA: carbohydrate-binding family 9-like protein [Candidatus Hydrogenedentes bacterium]|nr:carbohydrate-binding family 9-like protein [Candidatus Hydrogenedentota bacterium]HPG69067.1 carbohydrate-binding family 9-like protein [Candidatus Hydrogenedentota bacterium]
MDDDLRSTYLVHKVSARPILDGDWDGPAWAEAETLTVGAFHTHSTNHRPLTRLKMVHDDMDLYGLYRVADRYVRCTHTEYQSAVCRDACVEFFVRPRPDLGYFNFEMNCGGTLLASYIEDWTRVNNPARPEQTFEKYVRLPREHGDLIRIYHSMPRVVDPEIHEPVEWRLEFHIPIRLFEAYLGPLGAVSGQTWRANFNKCADESSHPHWATWAPIGEALNFHQPDYFGAIRIE